eukprot:TRINITY_DN6953_c0_g1_i2.p1 TRINITY_DN6953_c0_g1~~TRINITY_DN6953_c0_g1_i2.p1  ORF type:complete len:940 (+),score=128.66 TRINITY_DN6953_c0_g1_i2:12-2831(+)
MAHRCPRQFMLRVSTQQDVCLKCAVDMLIAQNTSSSQQRMVLSLLSSFLEGEVGREAARTMDPLLPMVMDGFCAAEDVQPYLSLLLSPWMDLEAVLRSLDEQAIAADGDQRKLCRISGLLCRLLSSEAHEWIHLSVTRSCIREVLFSRDDSIMVTLLAHICSLPQESLGRVVLELPELLQQIGPCMLDILGNSSLVIKGQCLQLLRTLCKLHVQYGSDCLWPFAVPQSVVKLRDRFTALLLNRQLEGVGLMALGDLAISNQDLCKGLGKRDLINGLFSILMQCNEHQDLERSASCIYALTPLAAGDTYHTLIGQWMDVLSQSIDQACTHGTEDQKVQACALLTRTVSIERVCSNAIIKHTVLPLLTKVVRCVGQATVSLPFVLQPVSALLAWAPLQEFPPQETCELLLEAISQLVEGTPSPASFQRVFAALLSVLSYPLESHASWDLHIHSLILAIDTSIVPAVMAVVMDKHTLSPTEVGLSSDFCLLLCTLMKLGCSPSFEQCVKEFCRKCVSLVDWAISVRQDLAHASADENIQQLLGSLAGYLELCSPDDAKKLGESSTIRFELIDCQIVDDPGPPGDNIRVYFFKLAFLYAQFRFDPDMYKFASDNGEALAAGLSKFISWLSDWDLMSSISKRSLSHVIFVLSKTSSSSENPWERASLRDKEYVLHCLLRYLEHDEASEGQCMSSGYVQKLVVEPLEPEEQAAVLDWIFSSDSGKAGMYFTKQLLMGSAWGDLSLLSSPSSEAYVVELMRYALDSDDDLLIRRTLACLGHGCLVQLASGHELLPGLVGPSVVQGVRRVLVVLSPSRAQDQITEDFVPVLHDCFHLLAYNAIHTWTRKTEPIAATPSHNYIHLVEIAHVTIQWLGTATIDNPQHRQAILSALNFINCLLTRAVQIGDDRVASMLYSQGFSSRLWLAEDAGISVSCLLYTSPSPRDS